MFMVSGVDRYCGNVWRLLTRHITSAVFFVPPVPAFFTHLGKTKCGNLLSDVTRLWAAAYPHVWWLKLSQSSYVSDVIVCCQLSRRRIRSKQTSDYMKEESVWQGRGLTVRGDGLEILGQREYLQQFLSLLSTLAVFHTKEWGVSSGSDS